MERKPIVSVASPQSLLDQCTLLVATHLDLVESFVGLPSLVGERIFNVGYSTPRFRSDVEYSTQAVRLFTDAYGDEFLSSLNVSGEYLGLNYCLEQILLFTDLVQLDLSYCGLGDDHEMLTHFQHLYRLEVLSLRGNAITDVGIQKMTTPYRMFSRGPAGIQMLDLRGNSGVSKQSLKYLTKFTFLNTVLYSESFEGKSKVYGCWRLSKEEVDIDIMTVGWAAVLIDRWMAEAKQKSQKTKPKAKTGAFSIRRCSLPETSSSLSAHNVTGNQNDYDVVARRQNMKNVPESFKNRAGINQFQGNMSHLDDGPKCDKQDIEDLYKVYGEMTEGSDTDKPLLKRLDMYDKDRRNTEKLLGPDIVRSGKGIGRTSNFFIKSARGKEKESDLDTRKVNKKSYRGGTVSKSADRKLAARVNCDKISKYFTAHSEECNEVKSDVFKLPKKQSICIIQGENSGNQTKSDVEPSKCSDKFRINSSKTTVSSVKINLQVVDSSVTEDTTAVNAKTKKRKRIVIKKQPDVVNGFYLGNETTQLKSVDNDNIDNYQKDLNKENEQVKKRFKSSLLHSLDGFL